jgi:sulfur carrier protein ThiS
MSDGDSIHIVVNLYSVLRHRSGEVVNQLELELPAGSRIQDALDRLEVPPDLEVVVSVNGRVADGHDSLHDGDRLAVIPAVAGG